MARSKSEVNRTITFTPADEKLLEWLNKHGADSNFSGTVKRLLYVAMMTEGHVTVNVNIPVSYPQVGYAMMPGYPVQYPVGIPQEMAPATEVPVEELEEENEEEEMIANQFGDFLSGDDEEEDDE